MLLVQMEISILFTDPVRDFKLHHGGIDFAVRQVGRIEKSGHPWF